MKNLLLLLSLVCGISYGQVIPIGGGTVADPDYNQSEIQNFSATVVHDSLQQNPLKLEGSVTIAGNLKYGFVHAVGSVDATSYTPSVSQNVYTKLVPTIVWREQDGLTCLDSVKILSAGDYRIDIGLSLSGANANDFWRLKIYKNGAAFSPELGRFRWRNLAGGITDTRSFFWYVKDLAVNDWVSFRITNETASRNPTITDFKVYIEQKPE